MRDYTDKIDASFRKLKYFFSPFVFKKITEKRRTKALNRFVLTHSFPNEKGLLSLPLFYHWPETRGKRLLDCSHLRFFELGTTLVLNGEPLATSAIIWVISGKLTELPTKEELIKCAKNNSDTMAKNGSAGDTCSSAIISHDHEPLTGPTVLPSVFQLERGSQSAPHRKFFRLTIVQEMILDRLELFSGGHVVASDCLLLGTERKRAIHCLTPVVAYFIPLKAFFKELTFLSSSFLTQSITIAKTSIQERLSKHDDKPSIQCILQENPILSKIDFICFQKVWCCLTPFAFKKDEVVCDDVYVADHIFFLHKGSLNLLHCGKEKKREEIVTQKGQAVGINSFVSLMLPSSFKDSLRALTTAYSELWGISFPHFLKICKESTTSCVLAANKSLCYSSEKLQVLECLKSIPGLSILPNSCLDKMCQRMKVRVYGPKECVAHANRCAREGLILVVGKAVFKFKEEDEERSEVLRSGEPYFFCEAFMKKVLSLSVFSETSIIVLTCSPTLMLEVMEESNCTSSDIELLYNLATKYIVDKYGHLDPRIEAQERAAARVTEYNRNLRPPRPRPSNAAVLERMKLEEMKIKNEIITVLEVRIQALHRDPVGELRNQFFADFSSSPLNEASSHYEYDDKEISNKKGSNGGHFSKSNNASESSFSVDNNGNVVFFQKEGKCRANPSSGLFAESVVPLSHSTKDPPGSEQASVSEEIQESGATMNFFSNSHNCGDKELCTKRPIACSLLSDSYFSRRNLSDFKPHQIEAEQKSVEVGYNRMQKRKIQQISSESLVQRGLEDDKRISTGAEHLFFSARHTPKSAAVDYTSGVIRSLGSPFSPLPLSSFSLERNKENYVAGNNVVQDSKCCQLELSREDISGVTSSFFERDLPVESIPPAPLNASNLPKKTITEVISQFRALPSLQRSDCGSDTQNVFPSKTVKREDVESVWGTSRCSFRSRYFRGKRNNCLVDEHKQNGSLKTKKNTSILSISLFSPQHDAAQPIKGGATSEGTSFTSPHSFGTTNQRQNLPSFSKDGASVSHSSPYLDEVRRSTQKVKNAVLGLDFPSEFRRQSVKPSLPSTK